MYDHIVLISLDTLRSDAIGAHPLPQWPAKYPGLQRPNTAALDALAANGAYFYNCVSAAPYTSASHATVFTGQWPLRHGVYEFFNGALRSPTLFTFGREHGHRTIFKTDFPIILGNFLGFDRDVDDYIMEDDERFLEVFRAHERTMCLVHFGGVHVPFGFHSLRYGGDAYREKVDALERELPDEKEPLADLLVESYRDAADTELLLRYKHVVQWHYRSGNYARLFELYLEGIEYFLEHRFRLFLERLMNAIGGKRHLVVLFGDHGDEYDAESYGHFNSVSDGVLQIPVIFSGTDVRPSLQGTRIRSIDIAPTVAELAGLQTPAGQFNGVSLASTVTEGAAYPERIAIAQTYTSNMRDFVALQKELLARGAWSEPMKHFLYKEVAYADAFRLQRRHHRFDTHGAEYVPCPMESRLERRLGSGAWVTAANLDAENHLAGILDEYNATRTASRERDRPPEVLQHLRNMGYEV